MRMLAIDCIHVSQQGHRESFNRTEIDNNIASKVLNTPHELEHDVGNLAEQSRATHNSRSFRHRQYPLAPMLLAGLSICIQQPIRRHVQPAVSRIGTS